MSAQTSWWMVLGHPAGDHPVRRALRDLRTYLSARTRHPGAAARAVVGALRHAPGTIAYLLAIVATWATLEGASYRQAERIMETASTNLHNMAHRPLRVLLASAFWIDRGDLWITLAEFLVVMAFVERWLGTWRTFAVFAAGHVGATLITVAGISVALDAGWASRSLVHTTDVGVSYGFVAVAAAATYAISHRRLRAAAIAVLVAYLVAAIGFSGTFTDYGHLVALAIGFAVYPLVRRRPPDRAGGAGAPDRPGAPLAP